MNNHSSSIALAMIIAFAIFIVWRGDLPKFLGILGIGGTDVTADQCNQGGGLVSNVSQAISDATNPGPPISGLPPQTRGPFPSTGPV